MPRLPGIAHLILTDKTGPENRMSVIDPVRISSFRIDPANFDTDGSIPDLTEILPPPRRKRGVNFTSLTSSFYLRKSPKRKKILISHQSFGGFHDLCA